MSTRRLTLESLEVLDAIDRKGSFAAAAASLYRVPSKITYTVNKLEEDLGVTLFRKEGRRSVLTPAGRLLLEQGREILNAADRLVENTRQLDRGWESQLRIALDSVYGFNIIGGLIAEFCTLQPGTEIIISEEVLGGSWEAIAVDRVDLVIGAPDETVDQRDLEVVPFLPLPWVFAVSPEHPLARQKKPIDQETLQAHRAVVVRDSSREHPALSKRVFDRQQRIIVASIEHKIAAQLEGLGAGFLPRPRIEHLLSSGALIEKPTLDGAPVSDSYLVWRSGNKGKALHWFIDRLKAMAADRVE